MNDLIKMLNDLYNKFLLELQASGKLCDTIVPDMTLNDEKYLEIIAAMDSPTFSEFAEIGKITKPAATQIIKKLIAKGYIEKTQSKKDKRVYYLQITKIVRAYFEEYNKIDCALLEKWLSVLDEDEKKMMHKLIYKFYKSNIS